MSAQDCRPPPGTAEGTMCRLISARTGTLREWRWTGSSWDKPSLYETTPEAMARIGWRFHSAVTSEEEPQ